MSNKLTTRWHTPEFFLLVWNIELMKLLIVTIAKIFRPCEWSLDLRNGDD